MFAYSTMTLPFSNHFFHESAITIEINNSCPLSYTNYIHLHFSSDFKITFFTTLKVLKLKNSSFSFFHANDQSLYL